MSQPLWPASPQPLHARVYALSGFTCEGEPVHGFNVWTDWHRTCPADVEAMAKFKGWASEMLDLRALVDTPAAPTRPGAFRVALMQHRSTGLRYVQLQQFGQPDPDGQMPGLFLGWVGGAFFFDIPRPEPLCLVRFRYGQAHTRLEGMFLATREELRACAGRTVTLARGELSLRAVLESEHFEVLSEHQPFVQPLLRRAGAYTLCGTNPVLAPS